MDAKWYKKLTWPFAMWVKNYFDIDLYLNDFDIDLYLRIVVLESILRQTN